MALGLEGLQLLEGADLAGLVGLDAGAGVLQHGQGVERDVGAAPGVGGRGQVVGVGLAGDLEDGQREALGHLGAAGEPLGLGPGLQHRLGVGVARVGLGLHLGEGVEDQQGLLQALGGQGAHLGIVQQVDEGLHVEAAEHGAQQLRGLLARDQGDLLGALGHAGQEGGLHPGGVIHAGGHAVDEEVQEESLLRRRADGPAGP